MIYGHPLGKQIILRMAAALQHRGQSATGIASRDPKANRMIEVAKVHGRANLLLGDPDFQGLAGNVFMTHTRYPTQGKDSKRNIQPHYTLAAQGKLVIASNGDVVNMNELGAFLDERNFRRYTDNDAELMATLIKWHAIIGKKELPEAIHAVMGQVRGAYSSVLFAEWDERVYAFRDPNGIRPLYYAEISDSRGTYYVVASETVAINVAREHIDVADRTGDVRIDVLREVQPGEILSIGRDGVKSYGYQGECRSLLCLMELLYLSRPDSLFDLGQEISFSTMRRRLGAATFAEHKIRPDVFCCVPRSGRPASIGYAASARVPYEEAIIQNPDLPADQQGLRDFIVSERGKLEKFRVIRDCVQGRHVGVGDDSIVEGITSRRLVRILRSCRISDLNFFAFAPPYCYPCYYGLHTKDSRTLVAARCASHEEIERWIGCGVHYLSVDRLYEIKDIARGRFCDACFTGNYPVPLEDHL
ncbi:MAG: hypothetical protein ABIG32_00560 [Candidatus Uhrbacteria bacterium]|nr:hypothetical protein [Patescibacteria group bacterium]MBU1907311.1 hypothetical protein [Patescibacteria group bacterium]